VLQRRFDCWNDVDLLALESGNSSVRLWQVGGRLGMPLAATIQHSTSLFGARKDPPGASFARQTSNPGDQERCKVGGEGNRNNSHNPFRFRDIMTASSH
jgi:hypothetical protein